jgi:hypothetical protein
MHEVMNHDQLDTAIRDALRRLVADLNPTPWFGRERELVSLFAFGHLLEAGTEGTPTLLPGQIGIEGRRGEDHIFNCHFRPTRGRGGETDFSPMLNGR